MHISADVLVELLGESEALFEGGGQFDISGRLPTYHIAADRWSAPGSAQAVKICNISSRGLGIMQSWPMEAGQRVELTKTTSDDEYLKLEAVVTWCRPTQPGSFLVSTEFIETAEAAQRLRVAA